MRMWIDVAFIIVCSTMALGFWVAWLKFMLDTLH